ncbi:DHA2 family efflux MFS transporter permease subunit [Rhodococcus sp. ABRD24]|uniref:DHA2 family efflux MFS transporter permease subunit n=1 Tax=Rhodococcus sp. ABRD24 TaxID=2507582 RepID=UPI00103A11B4|nr:DHA2 family efflux MFS transporter permease subunit [Rhodococcus sp. ABRD24]QBJ95646.1 DHA2 family efflux MFS transporter permease subunit [Rhodococcus sp. ABRD24]
MTTTEPGTGASDKLDGAVLKIASVVVLGAIMSILDVTVVSVALPTFAETFDTTYAVVAWTMTAYTLALATVIPVTGWAADRFGTKRLYMSALVLFVIGSVACAFAWDISSLIGFRVLQGLGGGMLMPLGMTIMTRAAGPERVGRVMAVLGIPMLLGPIGGPILGGWLIDAASWHWIFLINLPVGIVALVAAFKLLPKDQPSPAQSFDLVGMILLSPGLALFLYGVSSIPEHGKGLSPDVLVPVGIGLALIIGFVFHALRKNDPLIDLRLFKNRQLTIAVLTTTVFIVAFMGAGLLFPSYFIQVRGESALTAGLLLAPQGIGAMITMPIAGRLVDKLGPGKIVLTGLPLIALGMFTFTQLTATSSYPLLLGSLFVMGMGMGCTMMPLMTAAMVTLKHEMIARGSTLMNIVQQTAGSIGTATMSVVLTSQMTSRGLDKEAAPPTDPSGVAQMLNASAESFGGTFMVAFVLVLATLIPAFFLPRRRTVPTTQEVPVMMH